MSSPRPTTFAPTEEEIAIVAAEENMAHPGAVDHTQPSDRFGPYWSTLSSARSLDILRSLCNVPDEVEFALPTSDESPESAPPGYCCAYEVYFKGCGLPFPIPDLLLSYLNALGIALPQCAPNLIRHILCTITVAAETDYAVGLEELADLFSVRISKGSGTFTVYPHTNRALLDSFPLKDENWRKYWFFFKIDKNSVGGFADIFSTKWLTGSG